MTTTTRLLVRQADEAATAALRGAATFHGDAIVQSQAFDAAIGADDAAVLALAAVESAPDTLEAHVRAALAHADAVLRLTARAAS